MCLLGLAQVGEVMEKEIKPFLVIKKTYKVKCLVCGFKGQATLGNEPILTEEEGPELCVVCNHYSLVGDNGDGDERR